MDRVRGTFFLHGAAGFVHNLRVRAYTLNSPGPIVINLFSRIPMGSAASRDAIKAIRDWAIEGARSPLNQNANRATEVFGSLVFNDEVQQSRLPKPAYRALRR